MAKKRLPTINWFEGRAQYLKKENADRDEMYQGIDHMLGQIWEPPAQLTDLDWFFKQTDPSFAQTSHAAKRIIEDAKPGINIAPVGELHNVVDKQEKGLEWLIDNASRRRASTIVQDIVASAIDYAEVTQQVIFLPHQIESLKASGGNSDRYEAMQRHGEFVVVSHHPKSVHVRYSDMGPEEVLLSVEMDPHDVIDLWGDAADELKKRMAGKKDVKKVWLNDYVSYDWRAVWVTIGDTRTGGQKYELVRERWGFPFLPWVARIGGSSLIGGEDQVRKPLLGDAYHGDMWETMCRVRSLRYSDMLRTAGLARRVYKSDSGDSVEQDASSAALDARIDSDEEYYPIPLPTPDPSLSTLYAELKGDHQRSTLSDVLFGAEIPAGAAFSSINLVTHSALQVLKPPRALAERSIADLCEIFLLWIHYTQSEVVGYGTDEETDAGMEYLISHEEIDPKHLYIEVSLDADLPTDRQSRVATAGMALDRDLIDTRQGMEDIGVKNTSDMEDRIIEDKFFNNEIEIQMSNEAYMRSMQAQAEMRQIVMEQMQAEQESAEAGGGGDRPAPPSPGRQAELNPRAETGIPEEADPNMGGPVPAEFNEQATAELATGKTRSGEELAAV